jgi:hypothetical protein
MSRTILICCLLLATLMQMPAWASLADDLSYQAPHVAVDLQHVAWDSVQRIDKTNPGIAGWMPTKKPMKDLGALFAGTKNIVQDVNSTEATLTAFADAETKIPDDVLNTSINSSEIAILLNQTF